MPEFTPSNAFPQVTLRRPLVCVSVAQAALNLSREGVMMLVEDGSLRAFNLACPASRKLDLRIVAADLAAWQRQKTKPRGSFEALAKLIFPMVAEPRAGCSARLKVATLARQLNAKSQHIYHLVAAGRLRLVAGAKARRGPTGSPHVEFESVKRFLRARLVT